MIQSLHLSQEGDEHDGGVFLDRGAHGEEEEHGGEDVDEEPVDADACVVVVEELPFDGDDGCEGGDDEEEEEGAEFGECEDVFDALDAGLLGGGVFGRG